MAISALNPAFPSLPAVPPRADRAPATEAGPRDSFTAAGTEEWRPYTPAMVGGKTPPRRTVTLKMPPLYPPATKRTDGVPRQTNIYFKPFKPNADYKLPAALQGIRSDYGDLDLNRVTPDMVRNLSREDRESFFKMLKGQPDLAETVDLKRGPNALFLSTDQFLALQLQRQEPGGDIGSRIFESNPEIIRNLNGSLVKSGLQDEAMQLTRGVFNRLDQVMGDKNLGKEGNRPLRERYSRAMAGMTEEYLAASGGNQAIVQQLMEAADESIGRVADPAARSYLSGMTAGSLANGIKNSGRDYSDLGSFLPGRIGGVVTVLLKMADTTGAAAKSWKEFHQRWVDAQRKNPNSQEMLGYLDTAAVSR